MTKEQFQYVMPYIVGGFLIMVGIFVIVIGILFVWTWWESKKGIPIFGRKYTNIIEQIDVEEIDEVDET